MDKERRHTWDELRGTGRAVKAENDVIRGAHASWVDHVVPCNSW